MNPLLPGLEPALTLTEPRTGVDLEGAVAVLDLSFQAAPNFAAAYPSAEARRRALPHLFRLLVRDAAAIGGVTVAVRGTEVVGAAVWQPPGQLSLRRQVQGLPELLRALMASPVSFIRFARLGGRLERRRPPEPHAYLAALGVLPAVGGRGVGSALLRSGLARADALQQPCYLETFSERNVRLYGRHGFVVAGRSDDLIPGGPPFWFMARPPEASGVRAQAGLSPRLRSTGGPKYREVPT